VRRTRRARDFAERRVNIHHNGLRVWRRKIRRKLVGDPDYEQLRGIIIGMRDEGKTFKEIGRVLGLHPGTVGHYYQSALRRRRRRAERAQIILDRCAARRAPADPE
jgi:hypothetical protein